MELIQKRSPLTRWILVPIVFVASTSIIHGLVIIGASILSIFWGSDTEANLWFFKIILANGLSAYCGAYFSGWTAPKFQLATTCVAGLGYFFINSFLIYAMFTSGGWWGSDTIFTMLSNSGGAIVAILMAKKNLTR